MAAPAPTAVKRWNIDDKGQCTCACPNCMVGRLCLCNQCTCHGDQCCCGRACSGRGHDCCGYRRNETSACHTEMKGARVHVPLRRNGKSLPSHV